MNNLLVYHSRYSPKVLKPYTKLTPKEPFKSTIEFLHQEVNDILKTFGFRNITVLYDLATDTVKVIIKRSVMEQKTAEKVNQILLERCGLRIESVNVHGLKGDKKAWVCIQMANDIFNASKRSPLFSC